MTTEPPKNWLSLYNYANPIGNNVKKVFYVKVSELFRSNLFPDFKLLAGQKGLSNEICTVFIIDTPDFCNWLRGGELVIGNGYVFHNRPEQFPIFLKNLATHNAAALGMKFDRFRFADNYDEIIQLADRYDFPLIEVPFKYTWDMIFDEIYKKSQIQSKSALTNTSDLLSVIEERMDPLDLIYSLHTKIKREIFVYSNKLQLCHHIGDENLGDNHELALRFRRSTVIERMHPHTLGGIAINTQSKSIDGIPQKFASYRICNIEICVRLHGRENLLPASSEKPVINTLLLLYLMVMDDVLIMSSEKQKRYSLLERLLTGRYSDPDFIFSQFDKLRLHFPLPCVLSLFYVADTSVLQREIQPVTQLNCHLGEQMILIMSPQELQEKFDTIKSLTNKNDILGTYSSIVDRIEDIPTAFSEIRENIAWIKRLLAGGGFYSLDDVLLKIGISRFSELEEANAIIKKYWIPLEKHPQKSAISMDRVASTLIDANFNLSKTATNLSVHYNTARNYLDELENTLGVSFENPESRFLLMLARHIRSLNKNASPNESTKS